MLNLLSNAFKFTFEGRIAVRLEAVEDHAVLTVTDTGVGIPDAEIPHLFARFHRVEGSKGRTNEGTGIGLALIQELVKIHGGSVGVRSRTGHGSVFTVTLPFGSAHLPRERIAAQSVVQSAESQVSTAVRAGPFTGEALNWLAQPSLPPAREGTRPHILIADDNADMREYLSHILRGDYDLTMVGDGAAALKAARENPPDLLLSDVMMPALDGFGLLKELRNDAQLREMSVILLSARAGEEARAAGISAGADEYLTKPFSARELTARVETALKLQSLRRDTRRQIERRAAQFETLLNRAPLGVYLVDADFLIQDANPAARSVFGDIPDLVGRDFGEVIRILWPPEYAQEVVQHFRHTLETGESYVISESINLRLGRGVREYCEWRIDRIPLPDGRFGVVCYFRDISAQVQAREKAAESEEQLRSMVDSIDQLAWMAGADGAIFWYNKRWYEYTGTTPPEMAGWGWQSVHDPKVLPQVLERWTASIRTGQTFDMVFPLRGADGIFRPFLTRVHPVCDQNGEIARWFGTNTDISEQSEIQEQLRRANQDLEQFAYSASHDLQEPLRSVKIYSELLSVRYGANIEGQALEFLDLVRSNAARMEMLIRDLLAYTQSATLERPTETADAAGALKAALANLAGAISESGAKIDFEALPSVPVHGTHLQQLFQNLIGNAIKYRKPGESPAVHVTATRQHGEWIFGVSDNGIGIEGKYQTRIFGLFKRLHSADEYSGTGIGLAICQRIVDYYHGRIWVESELGKGAAFYFALPG